MICDGIIHCAARTSSVQPPGNRRLALLSQSVSQHQQANSSYRRAKGKHICLLSHSNDKCIALLRDQTLYRVAFSRCSSSTNNPFRFIQCERQFQCLLENTYNYKILTQLRIKQLETGKTVRFIGPVLFDRLEHEEKLLV